MNRLNHVFQTKHKIEPLVDMFGSREKAFRAIQYRAQLEYNAGRLNVENGIVKITRVSVRGLAVDVIGGRIVNGRVELANASRREIP